MQWDKKQKIPLGFAASGFYSSGQSQWKALGLWDTADAILLRAMYKNEALPVKQVGPNGEKGGGWIPTLETWGGSWRPKVVP